MQALLPTRSGLTHDSPCTMERWKASFAYCRSFAADSLSVKRAVPEAGACKNLFSSPYLNCRFARGSGRGSIAFRTVCSPDSIKLMTGFGSDDGAADQLLRNQS